MSAKSERKKVLKAGKRLTYGETSAWQLFKRQVRDEAPVRPKPSIIQGASLEDLKSLMRLMATRGKVTR